MNKLKFAVSLRGRHCRTQRGISRRNDGVCTGKKIKIWNSDLIVFEFLGDDRPERKENGPGEGVD